VLKILPENLPAGYSIDSMLWNPANNKVYLSSSRDNTVSIVDCVSDSLLVTIGTQDEWPKAMCCSDDGKVYVVNERGSVSVIDPLGDVVRKVIPVSDDPWTLCYDRTDNKVYVGKWNHTEPVSVIDVSTDSIVASLLVGVDYQRLVWDRNHDKVYVYTHMDSTLAVIDCANDTVLKTMRVSDGMRYAYSDSFSNRVYFANNYEYRLRVMDPGADTFYRRELTFHGDGFMIDNGRPGAANRLYCTSYWGVTVVATNPQDTILRSIQTGEGTNALAWNPTHSWVYVSNSDSGSITVVRDTLPVGVGEGALQALSLMSQATVVRGVLFLPEASSRKPQAASLLDISGRKVLDLKPGENDVRALAPGVYFIREAKAQALAQTGDVRKIVLTR
jgi:YVTN family beta-propeller protein